MILKLFNGTLLMSSKLIILMQEVKSLIYFLIKTEIKL